jgi:uncharacterized DUF497 family protein
MRDDEFEWDDDKAVQNLANHGISFEVARLAFDDAFAVERVDRRQRYDEDRDGSRAPTCVAYTLRGKRVRIISARYAEPRERRRYHEENS